MFLLNGVSMYPEVGLRPAEEYISSGTSHIYDPRIGCFAATSPSGGRDSRLPGFRLSTKDPPLPAGRCSGLSLSDPPSPGAALRKYTSFCGAQYPVVAEMRSDNFPKRLVCNP